MDAYPSLELSSSGALKISSCSTNTKNKQQMESRIHHEPDIRLLAEDKGLAVGGKNTLAGYTVHSE